MNAHRTHILLLTIALTVTLAACSSGTPTEAIDDTGPFLYPVSIGTTWTYAVSFSPDVDVTLVKDTVINSKTFQVQEFSWGDTRKFIRRDGKTWYEWDPRYPDVDIPFLKDASEGTTWEFTIEIPGTDPQYSEATYTILFTDTTHWVNDTTYSDVIILERVIYQKLQSDSSTVGFHRAQFFYARGVGLLELLPLVPGRELNRTLKSFALPPESVE